MALTKLAQRHQAKKAKQKLAQAASPPPSPSPSKPRSSTTPPPPHQYPLQLHQLVLLKEDFLPPDNRNFFPPLLPHRNLHLPQVVPLSPHLPRLNLPWNLHLANPPPFPPLPIRFLRPPRLFVVAVPPNPQDRINALLVRRVHPLQEPQGLPPIEFARLPSRGCGL